MVLRLLLVLAALGIATGGVGAWVWGRAAALPDWYDDSAPIPELSLDGDDEATEPGGAQGPDPSWTMVPDARPVSEAAEPRSGASGRRRRELRNFHLKALAREKAFRGAVRGSRAVFEDGRLELGVVVDTARIPRSKLGEQGRVLYDRANRVFPGARDRRVYLGITDEPISRDGYLQLGKAPRVKVGELTYSLEKAAKKMGVSPGRLRADVNRLFRQLKLVDPDSVASR